MKRVLLIIAILVTFVTGQQTTLLSATREIESTIKRVTVYPGSAKITRAGTMTLGTGDQSLLFEKLPVSAEDGSFRASAIGVDGVTLMGLSFKMVQHLEARSAKVAELEKKIFDFEKNEKRVLEDRLLVLEQQRKFLLTLSESGTSQMGQELKYGGIDINNWNAAYGFFSRQLAATIDSSRVTERELATVKSKIELLQREIQSLRSENDRASKTVQVDLRLSREGEVEVSLDYVVPNSNWKPIYDARLNANDEVELSYFAEVVQHTGEDWENVALTLSTSRPSEGTSPGDLAPWYLAVIGDVGGIRFRGAIDEAMNITSSSARDLLTNKKDGFDAEYGNAAGGVVASPLFAQIMNDLNNYTASFIVTRKESIPSGEKSVRAPIAQWTLKGETRLVSRPRNRAGAYRYVKMTNQNSAPLMPGVVNVFSESDFLGRTALVELIAPDQEFELPFGLDNSVTVKREILSRKKHRGSDEEKLEETVKITIVNRSKFDRKLYLEESLPTSNDNRIKVKLGDIVPTTSSQDAQGKAGWELALAPNSELSVSISYKIEYPLGIMISGL